MYSCFDSDSKKLLRCPSISMHSCFDSDSETLLHCPSFLVHACLTVILKRCCVALYSLCTLVLKVILKLLMLIYTCILIYNLYQDFQHYVSLHLKSTIPRQYVVVLTPANINPLIMKTIIVRLIYAVHMTLLIWTYGSALHVWIRKGKTGGLVRPLENHKLLQVLFINSGTSVKYFDD